MASQDQPNPPATKKPTIEELMVYLSGCTPQEVLQLVQSTHEPEQQAAITQAIFFMPPVIMPSLVSGPATAPKAKKALNAFVGFRCYYVRCPSFKAWPMKKLSNALGTMWDADPNKPLWTLITKAWSQIRDKITKDKAPLSLYFRIICPRLSLLTPETYFEHMGWEFGLDADNVPCVSRTFTPKPGSLGFGPEPSALSFGLGPEPSAQASALSVGDIIGYCMNMGYAQAYTFDTNEESKRYLGEEWDSTLFDMGVAERDARKARRDAVRGNEFAVSLQKEIAAMRGFDFPAYDPFDGVEDVEDVGLHDFNPMDFGLFLMDYSPSADQDGVPFPDQTAATMGAFRTGANEDVTLPFYQELIDNETPF